MTEPHVIPTFPPPRPTVPIPARQRCVASDRAISLLRESCDAQVHVVVRLAGHVEERRLARALCLLLYTEPVLGSRIVPGRRPFWERLPDLDRLPFCDLVEPAAPGAAGEAEETRYLASSPDSERLPMLRLRVFRRPEGDTLALKVNHLATDGGGSKECAYRLCALYNNLADAPDLDPTPNLSGRRSLRQVADQLGLWERLDLLRRFVAEQRRRRRPARFWRVPYREGCVRGAAATGRTYLRRRIDGEAFRRAKAYGADHEATVNDLVNAAYVDGLLSWIRPAADVPLRLRNTVDLRRYLPGGRTEAVCNCSSFTYQNLGPACAGGTDLPTLVSRVREEMRAQKAGPLGLPDWAVTAPVLHLVDEERIARFVRTHMVAGKAPEALTPSLSNIGRIHPERLWFGAARPVDAFATASVAYPPFWVVCATGFGDSLTLSAGFCESGLAPGDVSRLLDRMVEQLSSL